ncbi:tetratricopeptide repeat protein [Streptomyces populi]
MTFDDLDRPDPALADVSPRTVAVLLEHGHVDLLIEAAESIHTGGPGAWNCAKGAAGELSRRGEREAAWQIVAPYARPRHWAAVETAAELLESWGRAEEALALVRTQVGEDRLAAPVEARLLVAVGRTQEAVDLLRPHLEDWYYLQGLVDATEGAGCDEHVVGLTAPLVEQELQTGRPLLATVMLARVLERQGRLDEAVQALQRHLDTGDSISVNIVEALAQLLARHDRLQDLEELTGRSYGQYAVEELIGKLEALGRIDDALAAAERAAADHPAHGPAHLAGLLVRQGRPDEALEAARPLLAGRDCGCFEQDLAAKLVEHGHPDTAYGLLAELASRPPQVTDDEDGRAYLAEWQEKQARFRIWLLAETGRADEAIAMLEDLTDDEFHLRREMLAGVLENQGRPDEAIAVLAASTESLEAYELGDLLIRQGRAREAFAVFTKDPDASFSSVLKQ